MKPVFDGDKYEDEIFEALERRGPGTRRRLRHGESIAVPELGLSNAYLTGSQIWVSEYADGTIEPIIPNVAGLLFAIARQLVVSLERPLSGEEAAFLRDFLKLSQSQLAGHLGISRETLSRYENSSLFPIAQGHVLRLMVLGATFGSMSHSELSNTASTLENWSVSLAKEVTIKPRRTDLEIPFPGKGRRAMVRLTAAA